MTGVTGGAGAGLPAFRFHPDPVATGSVVAEPGRCGTCSRDRTHLYRGPAYGPDLPAPLCPWCIADGRAAREHGVVFTDLMERDGWGTVAAELRAEVLTRTPGFRGWQAERWLPHHDRPAVFLGRFGAAELAALGPAAVAAVREEAAASGLPPDALAEWLAELSADGSPTAYLFRCEVCAGYVGYSDSW